MTLTHPRIQSARAGTDPALICRMPSGWVFLSNMQFLSGYCILQSDPVVASINVLNPAQRAQFLLDMVNIGDAIQVVTGAYRINYVIAGNSDPVLHAHIIPRYDSEPEQLRKELPFAHPEAFDESTQFNIERDKPLMEKLKIAIQNCMK